MRKSSRSPLSADRDCVKKTIDGEDPYWRLKIHFGKHGLNSLATTLGTNIRDLTPHLRSMVYVWPASLKEPALGTAETLNFWFLKET